MRVFAVNSSARGRGQSMTELMLTHLVEGMSEAGAEIEVVNLREKIINNCTGCLTCWTKTPGICIHNDDMTKELLPKWLASDMVIYATPLYIRFMNSAMSAFRERLLPTVLPFYEKGTDGKTSHPLRTRSPSAAVWLSVCGFPDESEFEALSYYVNHNRHKDTFVAAEIYRSSARTMLQPFLQNKKRDILDATLQAGRELVMSMKVSAETMARIRQPLLKPKLFAEIGNIFWKTCIAEGVTPREFKERKMVPRPDSIESFKLLFPYAINAKAGGDKRVLLKFKFSGHVEDTCCFTLENGHVYAEKETGENPDITVEAPFDIWLDVMTRKADGRKLMMEQKYKVDGNTSLMAELLKIKDS